MVLIYILVGFTVLCGFVSLGVDWGRMQMIKTQLNRAADAAARAAAAQLSNGITATQNAAVTWGGYNIANGTSVVIDPINDVDFGTYNTSTRTFTVLTGAARSTANAVRVWARRTAAKGNATTLAFGSLVGMTTCDANSFAIAAVTGGGPNPGIVGINSMNLNQGNSGYIYSYDSSVSVYSSGANTSKATVASNGGIYMNNTYIYGDVKAGVGMSFSYGATSNYVSGTSGNLTTSLSYAAAAVGSYNNAALSAGYYNGTDITISTGTTSLPAGNFSVRNLSFSGGTTNSAGVTIVYVSGNLSVTGGTINSYLRHPGNLRIVVVGSGTISMSGSGKIEADVYGPGAAANLAGNSVLAGRIIAASLAESSNNVIYQDTYLTGTGWGSGSAVSSVK